MTHAYKRYGPTTLFATFDMAEGAVIESFMLRHQHQEWIKFLWNIDGWTDSDAELPLGADNCATHQHPKVQRVTGLSSALPHALTTISGTWLNQVER